MIEVKDLRKTYDSHEAVRGLTFTVAPGEILGLVGPNGAGKTTTLRCVAGILPTSSGRVLLAGHDISMDPVGAKSTLAFVADDPRLFDYLTVTDHLDFVARLYGVEDARERIPALLDEFELADKAHELPSALSRGMKQKLSIACAFLHSPRCILFDEPLTGLDPLAIRKAKDAIVERARQGASIVVSSHLLDLVQELADRILVLMKGQAAAVGTVAELKAAHPDLAEGARLEEIFVRLASGPANGRGAPAAAPPAGTGPPPPPDPAPPGPGDDEPRAP